MRLETGETMTRRTRAQHLTDDVAFPIRVKFMVPWDGLGHLSVDMRVWLKDNVGAGRFAVHSASAISGPAIGVYFVTLADAQGFVTAFPSMEIADGTASTSYYSPGKRTHS